MLFPHSLQNDCLCQQDQWLLRKMGTMFLKDRFLCTACQRSYCIVTTKLTQQKGPWYHKVLVLHQRQHSCLAGHLCACPDTQVPQLLAEGPGIWLRPWGYWRSAAQQAGLHRPSPGRRLLSVGSASALQPRRSQEPIQIGFMKLQ